MFGPGPSFSNGAYTPPEYGAYGTLVNIRAGTKPAQVLGMQATCHCDSGRLHRIQQAMPGLSRGFVRSWASLARDRLCWHYMRSCSRR